MDAWTQFFVRCGIPKTVSTKYAESFMKNRITKEMFPELDKSTLSELGVTAIGDQLLILKRIKTAQDAASKQEIEEEMASKAPKTRITGPEAIMVSTASEHRRGKPPPDRNEIYHVKMPAGNTKRTQKIMEKAEIMRQQGLAVRGTTGVRQGGRSVSPIDKTSLAARMGKKQSSEVSSTTGRKHGKTLSLAERMTISSRIQKVSHSGIQKTIPGLGKNSIVSRVVSSNHKAQRIRVHVDRDDNGKRNIQRNKRGDNTVRVTYEDEEMYDDEEEYIDEPIVMEYEDDQEDEYEEVIQVHQPRKSSLHQRISYTSRNPSTSSSRPSISNDSIFSRVSFQR